MTNEAGQALNGSAIEEVTKLARASSITVVNGYEIQAAVIPDDNHMESLEKFQFPDGRRPSRIKASVTASDAESFCKYFLDYRDDRSRVFANPIEHSFNGVLDYHGTGERHPEFLSHQVNLTLAYDERWALWFGKNEKAMTQAEFSEFIEDNRRDILRPDSATMLEVSRNLQATTEVNFASSTNLKNGQVQLRYEETVKAGVPTAGNMEVPEDFDILIPVFYGEAPVKITARLRFRIVQGKLSFHYKLYRPVEVVNDAFDKAVGSIRQQLKDESGTVVLFGKVG